MYSFSSLLYIPAMNKFRSLIILWYILLVWFVPSSHGTVWFESQVLIASSVADKYQTIIANFVDSYLNQYDVTVQSQKNLVITQRNKIIALLNTWSSGIRAEYVYALEYLVYKMDLWIDGQILDWEKELEILIWEMFWSDTDEVSKVYTSPWDTVSVQYVWALTDGTVFDTSRANIAQDNGIYNQARTYEPLIFTLWAGQMIQWFDVGVDGMYVWQTKSIYIDAADAYGEYSEEAIQEVPLDVFISSKTLPEVGTQFDTGSARWIVLDIQWDIVIVDFNHFLAGENLIFEVELIAVQ